MWHRDTSEEMLLGKWHPQLAQPRVTTTLQFVKEKKTKHTTVWAKLNEARYA